ncbi:hypothetical protein ACFL49_02725 [Candidatus Omnitrophota bacterium]
MGDSYLSLISQSMQVEFQISELYQSFSNAFAEDEGFWKQLALEESNHADMMHQLKTYFNNQDIHQEVLSRDFDAISHSIEQISKLMEDVRQNVLSREEAFNLALELEVSIVEKYYQVGMVKKAESEILKIFQKCNGESRDHIERIKQYMKKKGMR